METMRRNITERNVETASLQSPYLTPGEAARIVRLSKGTLANMRSRGGGPCFRKHGRLIRYHVDDLKAWSASRVRSTASGDAEQASPDANADSHE